MSKITFEENKDFLINRFKVLKNSTIRTQTHLKMCL